MSYENYITRENLVLVGIAAALTIVIFIILTFLRTFIISRTEKKAAATETIIDDILVEMLKKLKRYFLFFLSVYIALIWIKLPVRTRMILDKGIIILFLVQLGQMAGTVINFWVTKKLRAKSDQNVELATTVNLITIGIKAIVYAIILLLALDNLGVDITAFIAGLGVGGIAIALALQNILTDLFSSLTIVLDKPFLVGDFITVGEYMGTVEHIGLKTTRLRSLSGEQLVMGNGDLLQSRIRNYKRMEERRVVQNLTVTYQATAEQLEAIPAAVKAIVQSVDKIRFDRCHFLRYADSSLDFELVYWVLSSEFNDYANRAQKINVAIFRKFAEMGVEFAYPTRTLYMKKE
jgi:small-conductance mechanosensitive channel